MVFFGNSSAGAQNVPGVDPEGPPGYAPSPQDRAMTAAPTSTTPAQTTPAPDTVSPQDEWSTLKRQYDAGLESFKTQYERSKQQAQETIDRVENRSKGGASTSAVEDQNGLKEKQKSPGTNKKEMKSKAGKKFREQKAKQNLKSLKSK